MKAFVGPVYSHVNSQFIADRTKSRKTTMKPLKPGFIAPVQHSTVTVGPQMTPRGPAS